MMPTYVVEMFRVVAAVCILWSFDETWGQSVQVTETSILGQHASDYQYENVPSPDLPSSTNVSARADTNNTKAKSAATSSGDDGLFYPLYGGALARKRQREKTLASVLQPSPVPDFYDYAGGDEAVWPNGVPVGAKGPSGGMEWLMEMIRARSKSGRPMKHGPWANQRMSFGDDDQRFGGDVMESLRKEFQVISRHGLEQRLDDLQTMYPHVNVTQLYDKYQQRQMYRHMYGGEMGEREDGPVGFWHNGTFHFYNNEHYMGEVEADEGYWHNGTFYPLMDAEMEDGFWYNGTFYPGEMETPDYEDGFFHNGTFYHMGENEWPDPEDGYFYNGTFYPYENEEMEEGRGWYEGEDLMWWQLHHPRWRNKPNHVENPWEMMKRKMGLKNARGQVFPQSPWSFGYPNAAPFPIKQNGWPSQYYRRPPFFQSSNRPHSPLLKKMQNQREQMKQNPQGATEHQKQKQQQRPPPQLQQQQQLQQKQQQQLQQQLETRYRQLQEQWRLRDSRSRPTGQYGSELPPNLNSGRRPFPPPSWSRRQPGTPRSYPGYMDRPGMGQRGGKDSISSQLMAPPGNVNVPANAPGAQAMVGKPPLQPPPVPRKTTPLEPYSDPSTAAIGIIFACILGLMLILAPLTCMLHTYRQNKKMKKRTLLRRPELSGSVDESLVDAMVRSELGAVGGPQAQHLSLEHETHHLSDTQSAPFPAMVKSKRSEKGGKQWKDKRGGWQKGQRVKTSRGEQDKRRDIEMRELRGATAAPSSRPLPPCPHSTSSFLARHNSYAPRNTVIGAREELRQEQRPMSQPMTIEGMGSEDEINIV